MGAVATMCRRFVRTFARAAGTRIGQCAVGGDDHALGPDAAARRLQHEGRAVALAERRRDGRVLEDAHAACLRAVRERADPACRLHRAVLGRDVAGAPGAAQLDREIVAGDELGGEAVLVQRLDVLEQVRALLRVDGEPQAAALLEEVARPELARRSRAPRAGRRSSRRGSAARARGRSAGARRCGRARCRRSRSRRCGRSPPSRPCAPRAPSRRPRAAPGARPSRCHRRPAPITQTSTSRSTSSGPRAS